MNHYEELGVPPTATTAQIRQAYKSLVRVLHPDQQQDEDLRRLSELQLRRLNHLFQVLSDPEQRRAYDFSLHQYLPVPRQNSLPHDVRQEVSWSDFSGVRVRLRIKPGAVVWILIGAIALTSAIFWVRWPVPDQPSREARDHQEAPDSSRVHAQAPDVQSVSSTPRRAAAPASQSDRKLVDAEPAEPKQRLARQLKEVTLPDRKLSASAHAPVPKTRQNEAPLSASLRISTAVPAASTARGADPDPTTTPVYAADSKNLEQDPQPPVPKAPPASVSGKWLYVPQPDESKKTLYPAEYIELRINNRAGILRGKYHAKYRVSDRAISSEINFQFEGRQGEAVSILPWAGSNGSKGEMRVKRISDESIEVNWITTTFGQSNTLASGTAVLYRSDPP